MNTTLKYWREAATLLLAAGRRHGADIVRPRTPLPASGSPGDGSDEATHLPHRSRFDYDVLLLKRSPKSGFMPNAFVFPGGKVDASDFSSDWLDIFESFISTPGFGLRRVKQSAESRPPIFATDRLKLGSPIPGEVALRICAVRETFEESGVLLVVSKHEEARSMQTLHGSCSSSKKLCSSELTKWRDLVNQNPSNFIRMCRELELLPNIWALHEWANWLTPAGRYGGTRFDTAFFICCLQEIPITLQDEKEIVHVEWSTPPEILQSYRRQQLWIAPPQFYELSRMCRFPSLTELHQFAVQRASEGCEHWVPVVFQEDERHLSVLPGDKLYPLDSAGPTESDYPQDEHDLHRMTMLDPYTVTLQVTIKPKYNHLLPVTEPVQSHDSDSHL